MRRALAAPAAVIGLGIGVPAATAAPSCVTYSDRLTDGTGWEATTTADLTVTLYDMAEDGAVVFQRVDDDVTIADDYFAVSIGTCDDTGYSVMGEGRGRS